MDGTAVGRFEAFGHGVQGVHHLAFGVVVLAGQVAHQTEAIGPGGDAGAGQAGADLVDVRGRAARIGCEPVEDGGIGGVGHTKGSLHPLDRRDCPGRREWATLPTTGRHARAVVAHCGQGLASRTGAQTGAAQRCLLVASGPELIAAGFPLIPTLDHPHWTVVLSEPSTAQFARVRLLFHGPRADNSSFDPAPGDQILVGDDEEASLQARVVHRDGDRVTVQVELTGASAVA
jgi:hypothetical protein